MRRCNGEERVWEGVKRCVFDGRLYLEFCVALCSFFV